MQNLVNIQRNQKTKLIFGTFSNSLLFFFFLFFCLLGLRNTKWKYGFFFFFFFFEKNGNMVLITKNRELLGITKQELITPASE